MILTCLRTACLLLLLSTIANSFPRNLLFDSASVQTSIFLPTSNFLKTVEILHLPFSPIQQLLSCGPTAPTENMMVFVLVVVIKMLQ